MDKPELWLLRHGTTAWSRSGRHTGSTDIPLVAEGEGQARRLAPALAGHPFTAVLTSPLQRARRTCDLAGLGAQASPCANLREWDYGAYEGLTTAEIRQTVPAWTVWSHGCPEGDTAESVQGRCEQVIGQALAAAGPQDMAVALFAHGHILRALAAIWLGLGASGGRLLALDTATISVLGFERDSRVIRHWNSPASSWGAAG
ncbi:MAG: histidine phosphatase family protein [Synechococcus sp. Baikal-G1]|nr:MAG: histidine phosphatase family protein [Synechococcus sp. Baikal-G1]